MKEKNQMQAADSGSGVLNGIDNFIIDPDSARNKEYLEFLVREITRVAGPDHCILGRNSEGIFRLLPLYGFEKNENPNFLEVFRKK